MAVHIAPDVLINPRVHIFGNDLLELASTFGFQLSGDNCTDLLACISSYIKQAVRHDEGAPSGDVERVLTKIRGALKEAMDELTTLDHGCFENYFRNGRRYEFSAPSNEQERKKKRSEKKRTKHIA